MTFINLLDLLSTFQRTFRQLIHFTFADYSMNNAQSNQRVLTSNWLQSLAKKSSSKLSEYIEWDSPIFNKSLDWIHRNTHILPSPSSLKLLIEQVVIFLFLYLISTLFAMEWRWRLFKQKLRLKIDNLPRPENIL